MGKLRSILVIIEIICLGWNNVMIQAYEKTVLAGGCFWCIEHDLKTLVGVIDTQVGYSGGTLPNPTYELVSRGDTGYIEVVEITYNPNSLSYGDLLRAFWMKVDPFDAGGQFCDRGEQYRTVVFYSNLTELAIASNVKKELESQLDSGPFATDLIPIINFYSAEEYHQDYAEKNPAKYSFYRWTCGRDERVKEVWGN